MTSIRRAVFIYTVQGVVPKDMTIVHFSSVVTHLCHGAFGRCTELREVVHNEGLLTIGKYAFDGCRLLKSITLPSTVTDICAEEHFIVAKH